MLRIVLLAILFGFAHALPAASDIISVTKRGKYGYTPKMGIVCPSSLIGVPFYIQESFAGNYAQLGRIPAFDPDASEILFDLANQADGTLFTFIQDADNLCQLSIFPTDSIPSPVATTFRSTVFSTPNPFARLVYINGPLPPVDLGEAETYCGVAKNTRTLSCQVKQGGITQSVLQLLGKRLAIGSSVTGRAATFTLIPLS